MVRPRPSLPVAPTNLQAPGREGCEGQRINLDCLGLGWREYLRTSFRKELLPSYLCDMSHFPVTMAVDHRFQATLS
jgi:hypothetical protein